MRIILLGGIIVATAFVATFAFLSQRPAASSLSAADDASNSAAGPTVSSRMTQSEATRPPESATRQIAAAEGAAPVSAAQLRVSVNPATAPLTEAQRKRQASLARIAAFESGKGWREIVERALLSPASLDLEERYLAARAMDICENQRGRVRNLEQERETYIRSLPANETQRAMRLAAHGQIAHDPCSQLQGLDFNRELVDRMLKDAGAEGDPKARVLLVEKDVRSNPQLRSNGLSSEQRTTLRDALVSHDPASIRRTGEILMATSSTWQNAFGPDGERVEPWLVNAAWRLVACDHGMPCGPDSTAVLNACAYNGRCDAQSHEQLMQMYDLGSQRYAQVQRYRGIIAQAITEGRWNWIGLGG